MKLLVVDQDTDCRGDVARVLTQMGHRVEEFSTGREALRRLGQTPVPGEPQPQLVLTEMLTGEITGIDLLSWVRNVGDFRDIGVIFLTAPLDLDTLRQALDQGLTGYISKPLDLELLGSQVEDLVSCIPEVSEPGSMELASQSSLSSADDSLEDLDLSGEILEGKYGLDGLIAHGETGTVYRARNLGLDQAVAIQILDGSAGRTKRLFSRFIREIRKREETEQHLIETNNRLRHALSEIRTLRGILPICSFCKKIRNNEGNWEPIEIFIQQRVDADFSHSVCSDCMKEHYPQYDSDPG